MSDVTREVSFAEGNKLIETYPGSNYIETSAKNGSNVNTLFKNLIIRVVQDKI